MEASLSTAIKSARFWTREPGGYRPMLSGPFDALMARVYTKAEFDALDPRMFPVLESGLKSMMGGVLLATLAFWDAPVLRVPQAVGINNGVVEFEIIPVSKILQFYCEGSAQAPILAVAYFVVNTTTCGIEFAYANTMGSIKAEKSWLDTEFPGWAQRYAVAKELGVDDATLVDSVLQVPPVRYVTAALPDELVSPCS